MPFTQTDLVKYPFLPQAQDYIRHLNLTIQELTETPRIVERAEQRVAASFETAIPLQASSNQSANPEIEIASFPIATILVAAIGDRYLKKRYALHEAKRIYGHLSQETPDKIRKIAQFFTWNLTLTDTGAYSLHFVDFLQNSTALQEPEWKLINRQLSQGRLLVTQHEAARLLQEEVRRYVEAKLDTKLTTLPSEIRLVVEKLKNTLTARKGSIRQEEYPQTVNPKAFPPCIKALHDALSNGHHLSHTGRFALTTFLVNIGMSTETILDLYRNVSDFNERLTRYQVEHIAGERGSRTKYKPPTCQTLRTHGICTSPDEDCRRARRLLVCYKRKLRQETT